MKRRLAYACIKARNGFHLGQLVKTSAGHRKLYPRSKANHGAGCVLGFCRGTELRVKFPLLKNSLLIDERFLEPLDNAIV